MQGQRPQTALLTSLVDGGQQAQLHPGAVVHVTLLAAATATFSLHIMTSPSSPLLWTLGPESSAAAAKSESSLLLVFDFQLFILT